MFRPILLAVGLSLILVAPVIADPDAATRKEVRLDLDGDGKLDLARLVEREPRRADLHIFYQLGDAPPAADRKPDVVQPEIASNLLIGLSTRDRSLMVTDDCGGCTQSMTTKVTIVHRGGRLIVGGVEFDWEYRDASGRCHINFLTGRGGQARPWNARMRSIRKPLRPIPLATWDRHEAFELCETAGKRR